MLEGNHILILLGFQSTLRNLKEKEAQKSTAAPASVLPGMESHVDKAGLMHHNLLT